MWNPQAALLLLPLVQTPVADAPAFDVVVYGGTSAGIVAATRLARLGRTVIVVSPDEHLGGLSSSGLGFTDSGDKRVVGGLAREFYHRIWQHYAEDDAWRWQTRTSFGDRGQHGRAIDQATRTMWVFEPHVAEAVFESFVSEAAFPVVRGARLDREGGVDLTREGAGGPRIARMRTTDGTEYTARLFIDATYEGDLMAAAGVSYAVGRESNDVFGETWNGVQPDARHHGHHFGEVAGPVDPYVVPGDPTSGLIPLVGADRIAPRGSGDARVQSYCFRLCMSDHPDNRVPFEKPEGYDPARFELMARIFEAGWRDTLPKFDPMPNRKTDTNNHGPLSFDYVGGADEYPDASDERRAEIVREHELYQRGLLYFLRTSPRVPASVREQMTQWGLAADEFEDNGHWPYLVYVREARRMRGRFTMTEHEVMGARAVPEPVGMGSYVLDSHNVQRYVTADGRVENEGDVGVRPPRPYGIAYGSIVPREAECANLLVPAAVSASHIAFGSIRMEPVFMVLADSAACAADLALEAGSTVQSVPYERLRAALDGVGQVVEIPADVRAEAEARAAHHVDPASLSGVVVDDAEATLVGPWSLSTASARFVGASYHHDGDRRDGASNATFEATVAEAGRIEVRVLFPHASNRSTRTLAKIAIGAGEPVETRFDQRNAPPIDGLGVSLGVFDCAAGQTIRVTISNAGADGHVVVDAVQFVRTESGGSTRRRR